MHGELAKLGISISQAAVSKYMVRHRKPPSQTWRSFLDNHLHDLVSVDFFTLPTASTQCSERGGFRNSDHILSGEARYSENVQNVTESVEINAKEHRFHAGGI